MSQSASVIELSEQQLYDYMNCPIIYYLKYVNKITLPEHLTQHKLMSRVMKYFFVMLHNGKIPTLKELQRKWDSICAENKDIIDKTKNISGWAKLVNFAKWSQHNQIIVGDVNIPYSINIQNVILKGNIEQVLVDVNTRKVELFYPNFTDKEFSQYSIDSNLKYTIDAYAFQTLFKEPINGVHIYSAKSNKDFYTIRGERDFLKLKTCVYNIGNAILNKYYYPRENVLCDSCAGRAYCKYWSMNIQ